MSTPHIYLLPGMDGTGLLLGDFCAAILNHDDADDPQFDATILSLPTNIPNSYECLAEHFSNKLFRPFASEKYVLIAESFSGPLAVKLAATHPDRVAALVLVATLLRCPVPSLVRIAPWSLLFRFPLPAFVVSRLMAGPNASPTIAQAVRQSVAQVPRATMGQRVRTVITADVRAEFSQLVVPTLFIEAANDRVVPWNARKQVTNANVSSQLATINGHHLVLQTQPDQAWCMIRDFLVAL